MRRPDELRAYASDALRTAEAHALAGLPDGTLMRRAAWGLAGVCADVLRETYGGVNGQRVVLLVGTGNNGGDALLAGALLRRRGAKVDALLVGDTAYPPGLDEIRAAGATVFARASTLSDQLRLVDAAQLVVDGIVGIGSRPGLREPAASLIGAVRAETPVVAVDLPSGVNPDTGEAGGSHVRADVTVSFGALSPCLLLPPASHAAGRVVSVDVGVQEHLVGEPVVRRLTPRGVAARWPVPHRTAHKYTRGVLGVIAGSDMYPGAAVLACLGAVRAGVGVVRYIGPAHVTDHCLRATPEIVPGTGRVQAWLLGSGVDGDTEQDTAITQALASGLPCLVDAGALEPCVRQRADGTRPAPADKVLMTPHAGELACMLVRLGHEVTRENVESQPMRYARWLAEQADATVLLKGPTTLIAAADGRMFSQDDGPSWLATAGSGDVLAGIAGALLSAGVDALHAAAMAAMVHGRAGARASGGGPITASEIAAATPATIAELLGLLTDRRGT